MLDGAIKRKHRTAETVVHDSRPHKKPHHHDQPPHGFDLDKPESNFTLGHSNGDTGEDDGSDYNLETNEQQIHAMNLTAVQPRLAGMAATDTAEWQRTIEKVVRNVVSIRFCQTCSFDTDEAITSEATGFVVDAERGYIMTNRHVVCAGPFWGYCVFDNHEEVSLSFDSLFLVKALDWSVNERCPRVR